MAKRSTKTKAKPKAKPASKTKVVSKEPARRSLRQRLRRFVWRVVAISFLVVVGAVLLGSVVNPPSTAYMFGESRRLGGVDQEWVPLEEIAPVMARAAVAAEDANFCDHWGFDVKAIRSAIAQGSNRGASTISQQTVKNVYLWHGRTWVRKALEAGITPLVEAVWPKRRILEVYLNVAEFDEGVFGVEAAARHYFGIGPEDLTARQASQLAAVLPSPKRRSASRPTAALKKRAAQIRSGAATIKADGRADCFES
ncbi:monofunctional biosynthetic peptidoglycan transglycosylase [Sulfitobacter donghicola]|uniref:Biosynthetic peptidoglycan transglycosylase n=1 Tax=Sulfitobacter donghicola DSW-25 = KCTC 12864 = JCM 14565 TaxID=1300350 RepID=A0A073IMJ8_9RHOB|nr:monofunctional biosynthetic peptidoglycan transglycosylase [Sulfitobacter donghicola]KEJ90726.1 peptidoglycan transglycosylase [Sulfitobacter donghicola DSW-25 = KCTC 12864 = JCM 14565]